jgi:hypothetical protein
MMYGVTFVAVDGYQPDWKSEPCVDGCPAPALVSAWTMIV